MSAQPGDLVEIGRYLQLTKANEHALVILASGCGYWLLREGDEYVLCVREAHRERVLRELATFETEKPPAPPPEPPPLEARWGSLLVFAWVLTLFFMLQNATPPWWKEAGIASAEKVLSGEWWRVITALTLHADLAHYAANLATGLLFAAFLRPIVGTGLCWLGIVLSGGLGNFINAWTYKSHLSIGASTAVFGALGMLVACQAVSTLLPGRRARLWEIILPIGAGLALLAFLGTGSETEPVDYMAHFWGFLAGTGIGALIAALRLRPSPAMDRVLGGLALLLPAGAWALACL